MFELRAKPFFCTGVVTPLQEFLTAEDRAAGKKPGRKMRGGLPVSAVEILITTENFGRPETEVFRVEVPDSKIEIDGPGQVIFEGLAVKPWVRNGSSVVRYSFKANSVRSATDEDLAGVDSSELAIF